MSFAPPREQPAVFPRTGSRARRLARFERDLQSWLATPGGQFARWRAACAVADATPLVGRATAPDGEDRAAAKPDDVS